MPAPLNVDAELAKYLPGTQAAWASGWNPVSARAACDAHKLGTFTWSYQLAIDCTAYPPIKAASAQRMAESEALPYEAVGPTRAPGRFETEAAQELLASHLLGLIHGSLTDHAFLGMFVWQHPIVWNDMSGRFEVTTVEPWPMSAVLYLPFGWLDDIRPGYFAINSKGERIRLPKPGTTDGHWTVGGRGMMPHLDGAVTAVDVSFTKGQLARRAEGNLINTIGRASVVGELPDTIMPKDPEGKDMLDMIKGLGTTASAGVHPKGGKVYPFELVAQTGTLFTQILEGEARMVAWALLGVDATLGRGENVYNDPGLQAVPQHLKRRDVGVIETAGSNLFAALAALNNPKATPAKLVGHLPDADQDKRLEELGKRQKGYAERLAAFHAAIAAARGNGFEFKGPDGQKALDVMAERSGVEAPILPPQGLPPALVKLPPATTTLEPETAVQPPASPAAP